MSSSRKAELLIAPCSHAAAKWAVEHWHYSKSMPRGKAFRAGVWEDNQFIGAVIISRGACPYLGDQYGLTTLQIAELTRIALRAHVCPVSRILKIAISIFKRDNAGTRLIVSFADEEQGHHGGIYAGAGWLYAGNIGASGSTRRFRIHGRIFHARSVGGRGWTCSVPWLRRHIDPAACLVPAVGKHKYLLPLDAATAKQIEPLRQPYPKRVRSADSGTPVSSRRGQCKSDPDAPSHQSDPTP